MSEEKEYMSTGSAPDTCCPDQKYVNGICQGCGLVKMSEAEEQYILLKQNKIKGATVRQKYEILENYILDLRNQLSGMDELEYQNSNMLETFIESITGKPINEKEKETRGYQPRELGREPVSPPDDPSGLREEMGAKEKFYDSKFQSDFGFGQVQEAYEYIKKLEEHNKLFKKIINFLISKSTRDGWIYKTISRIISIETGKSIDEVLNED